ncbi:PQQ-binding-like beta-propeller repeat protein [Helicobacter mesocricetorum]|uniref:hypothetical protein n=1 Tax=Helicobacter mesocricetorum TaxID=87012 RepID=UPI000CF15FBE|nr:hypothetical protein [Helicobacter mesocricetorum]
MKKFSFVGYCLLAAFIMGCGSKFYFNPKKEEIKGSIAYTKPIGSPIVFITRNGATLKNGQFITKNGEIPKVFLPKNARYLNESEDYYLATNNLKELILIHKDTKEYRYLHFDSNPVSASMQNNLIALVFDNNTLSIFDVQTNKNLYKLENPPAPTNDTLIASPYFLGDIIILPTLDGKLAIIDKINMKMVRNIVVNGDKHFNNVIFLEAIDNRMVAATPKRIISVNPSVINTFEANIKDVLFVGDRIFLFTSEGEVILTDRDLNETKRIKFPFAHFTGANHGQKISILETRGYMINMEDDLSDYEIIKIPSKIKNPVFSGIRKTFINDSYFEIK